MRQRPVLLFVLGSILLLIVPPAHSQTFNVLYNFGNVAGDPYSPQYSGIIAQGRDGNLYTTSQNGGSDATCGAIFKITPAGTVTVIHNFYANGYPDGCQPLSGLTLGTDGNFYGTTQAGGLNCCNGTIFKVTPAGTVTILYNFTGGTDGGYPYAPPIQGTDGNWYGTTPSGGTSGQGVIYKLTPTGTYTALYQFDGGAHGGQPHDPLVQGVDGNLYGTTLYGGSIGYGTVFKITTTGKLTVLYNFDNTHGGYSDSPLIQASDGNFYGTTEDYGSAGGGVVFKITPTGNLSVIHNMNASTDGDVLYGGLVQASDGNLYGANAYGGSMNDGTLFSLTTGGVLNVLYNFDLTTGFAPEVTLVQHTNGTLYGDTNQGGTGSLDCAATACGVFYSLSNNLPPFAGLVSTVGKVGSKIGILGQGFSASSVVKFGSAQATIALQGTTFITATVPSGATTGSVTVTTGATTLTSKNTFRVTPQLTSFTPSTGPDGTSVTFTGVSLSQTSKVTFGGVASKKITINSDLSVTAVVPPGAKTGPVALVTPGGTATSKTAFTVQPSIASFTPTSGPVGTAVTIKGGGFTGATNVSFNGVSASFTFNSDSQVTATVPSGATTGPISVTTPGGTASSTSNFTVN